MRFSNVTYIILVEVGSLAFSNSLQLLVTVLLVFIFHPSVQKKIRGIYIKVHEKKGLKVSVIHISLVCIACFQRAYNAVQYQKKVAHYFKIL